MRSHIKVTLLFAALLPVIAAPFPTSDTDIAQLGSFEGRGSGSTSYLNNRGKDGLSSPEAEDVAGSDESVATTSGVGRIVAHRLAQSLTRTTRSEPGRLKLLDQTQGQH